jgi:hypothetical protein
MEAARAVATSRGAVFVFLAQADPVANPEETDQESLLPENLWRYRHVRDLQRRFAEEHPEDTAFVDLQPIVCPDGSCAEMTMSEPGMRADGLHFLPGTVVPIAGQIEDAFDAALGRTP